MMGNYGKLGVVIGGAMGTFTLLMLMMSGSGDDVPAMQTYLIAAAIVFGSGLIAGALETGRKQ